MIIPHDQCHSFLAMLSPSRDLLLSPGSHVLGGIGTRMASYLGSALSHVIALISYVLVHIAHVTRAYNSV